MEKLLVPPTLESPVASVKSPFRAPIGFPRPQTRAAILEATRVFDVESLQRAMDSLADNGWNAVVLPGFLGGYPIFSSQVWADYGLRRKHPAFKKWEPFETAFDLALAENPPGGA